MQKIGYTQTNRDSGGPVFFFTDSDNTYRLRLAGNPILLLESYYNIGGGTEFMESYKNLTKGNIKDVSVSNVKIMKKAQKQCKEFFDAILELQRMKKSLLVIYKE